jgi:hypothetical protein
MDTPHFNLLFFEKKLTDGLLVGDPPTLKLTQIFIDICITRGSCIDIDQAASLKMIVTAHGNLDAGFDLQDFG